MHVLSMLSARLVLGSGLVVFLTVALSLSPGAESLAETTPVIFTAHEYEFTGPDRIPAGMTTVQIVNKGQDFHHIQLVRLLEGKTAEDFFAALKAGPTRFPTWPAFVGGPNLFATLVRTCAVCGSCETRTKPNVRVEA